MIYKKRDVNIDIRSTYVDKGDIGLKIYTKDRDTASINMYIRYGGKPFNFTEAGFEPKLHLFLSDGSIFLDEPVTSTDPENGLVVYNVPDHVVKHSGKVRTKLFLEFPEGEPSIHVSNFLFEIVASGIDEAVAKEINIDTLEALFNNYMQNNPDIVTGGGSVITIVDGYLAIDGVKTEAAVDLKKVRHNHTISEVDNLQVILDSKLDKTHAQDSTIHITTSDRKIWDAKLSEATADNKYVQKSDAFTQAKADTLYAPIGSTGTGQDVDLSSYSTTEQNDLKYSPIQHKHTTSDITDLQSKLDVKADKIHTHTDLAKIGDSYTKTESDAKYAAKSDIPEGQDLSAYQTITEADNKFAPKTHKHEIADVNNLQTSLDGKANNTHTHAISNVTGLQSALDSKAASTHAEEYI